MRKITQLFIAISFTGFGQTTIDFEPEGVGMDWNWTVDDNGCLLYTSPSPRD